MNQKKDKTLETLTESQQSANSLCDNLRSSLHNCDAVQGLIIMDFIEKANKLRIKIEQLKYAISCQ